MPRAARDAAWQENFKAAIWNVPLFPAFERAVHGPDGYPYFMLTVEPTSGSRLTFAQSVNAAVASSCGLAILDPDSDQPHYVFSHGDLIACERFGDADVTLDRVVDEGVFRDNSAVLSLPGGRLIGSPNERFLPRHTRDGMTKIVAAYGILEPRINAFFDPALGVHVAINLSDAARLNTADDAMRGALGQLAWFLPRCYQLCVEPADVPPSALRSLG